MRNGFCLIKESENISGVDVSLPTINFRKPDLHPKNAMLTHYSILKPGETVTVEALTL